MKTLQQLTVSLEMAQKLKEAGFDQESLFYWIQTADKSDYFIGTNFECCDNSPDGFVDVKWLEEENRGNYAAPTATELLEVLPDYIEDSFDNEIKTYYPSITWDGGVYEVNYTTPDYDVEVGRITDKSLANALAKMYIYLKNNNLLSK